MTPEDDGTSARAPLPAAWCVVEGSAGSAVQAHLAEQVDELLARAEATRLDRPDALHRMRVATRRLRSALATFRPLLDRSRTDPLRDELRWLDAQVVTARRCG